jgi:hypothetical protein
MAESLPSAASGRWRPRAGFFFRTGRRTVVESLYLLTAPVIAAAGLLLVLGGLCVGTVLSLLPGGSRAVAGALAPARWFGDLERWRIATVRAPAAAAKGAGGRPGPRGEVTASDPELWLEVAHAVAVFPVALVTSVVTGLWWFAGLGAATSALRGQFTSAGPMRPMTLYVGSARSHIALSLGLTSPGERFAFGTVVGLLLLFALPLVTRACLAVQAGLGQALLSDASALHRRIRGLEQERDTCSPRTVTRWWPWSVMVPPWSRRCSTTAASYHALHELLELCQRAGQSRCSFAGADTPARFARLAARLRARPLRLAAPGAKTTIFTYPNLIADTEHWLHDPSGYRGLFAELTDLARLTAPGGAGPRRAALVRRLLRLHGELQPGPGFDTLLQAQSGVLCTDSRNAADAASWPAAAAAADRRTKYFGAFYAWITVQCARNTWTVQDQDTYRGPFGRHTAAPVLLVGNTWDPVNSYGNAVQVAHMLPNSRLIASDSWGHEAVGTSACVDQAVFRYLIHPLAAAPEITRCRGNVQPFGPSPSAR